MTKKIKYSYNQKKITCYSFEIIKSVIFVFATVSIIFTFGVCTLVMHIGVFVEDLSNLVNIGLRMLFYMTGIFFDIASRIHNEVYRTILLDINPLANFIYNMRNILIYSTPPVGMWTLIWFFISIWICVYGINTIYKYENTYVKVMK